MMHRETGSTGPLPQVGAKSPLGLRLGFLLGLLSIFCGPWTSAAPAPAQQETTYWLRLGSYPDAEQAGRTASLVHKDWTAGGRLRHVMVRASTGAVAGRQGDASRHRVFEVLLGPYDSLPEALIASYRLQATQPWLDKGLVLGAVPVCPSGLFLSMPVRFDSELAKACRAGTGTGTGAGTGTDMGQARRIGERGNPEVRCRPRAGSSTLDQPRGTDHPGRSCEAAPEPNLRAKTGAGAGTGAGTGTGGGTGAGTGAAKWPKVAEVLTPRGFGYAIPLAYVPPVEQSVAQFRAWDRLLVWGQREVCAKQPRVVGGPKPHIGPGPKDMTPQVHPEGTRCLRWLIALTPDMKLAWFPATQLATSAEFKKTTLATRWGPLAIRYRLNRVGRSPKGIVYQAVVRAGGFPPLRKTVVISDKYPLPHRLGFDRLGGALFEGRGLIVRRISIRPPAPPVPPLWKRRTFKGYLTYHPPKN